MSFFQQYEQVLKSISERRTRESSTVEFLLGAVHTLGCRYLLDYDRFWSDPEFRKACMNARKPIYNWSDKISCYRHWLTIFELSETPLVTELEKKLQNSSIPIEEFCKSIVEAYFILDDGHDPTQPGVIVTSQDVMDTITRLNFTYRQYECLKILLSLKKIRDMKI